MRSGFGVHTMHHFVLPKLRLVFSQRTCPIDFFMPKTKFPGGFARFRCREVQVERSGVVVHKMHHFVLPKLRLVFSQRTCPINFFRPKTKFLGGFARFRCGELPVRPKTKFLGGFARFRCREVPVVRSGYGVHKMHHFVLPKFHLFFFATNMPNPLH